MGVSLRGATGEIPPLPVYFPKGIRDPDFRHCQAGSLTGASPPNGSESEGLRDGWESSCKRKGTRWLTAGRQAEQVQQIL